MTTSFEVGNECKTFSVKFEPDIEMPSDTFSIKHIKIENKIDKIGTAKKSKNKNQAEPQSPKTLAQLKKSNSLISKSFENSDEPNEYEPLKEETTGYVFVLDKLILLTYIIMLF